MSILRKAGLAYATILLACTGDDTVLAPDSGPPKSDATLDQSSQPPPNDASPDSPGPRVLMTYSASAGELVGYDINHGQVLGRLSTPGYTVVMKTNGDYFALETGQDTVVRLDPASQWQPVSSWSVALTDGVDGGEAADPVDIVEVAANKAYVLRYNRNQIAIIDPSQTTDAGTATGIDLSGLVQAADTDGYVEATAAVFVPSSHLLYVALSNIDLNNVFPTGYYQLCGTTVSTLIAIDTMTDTLVNLSDAGPGGGLPLNGVAAQNAYYGSMVYDAVGNRILLMSTGCNVLTGDGGLGATSGRLIEAIDLATNTTQTLLDLNAQPYPGVFSYIDGAHALVQVGFYGPTTYQWIPTETTLGPALPTTPDLFDLDYAGNRIIGPQQQYALDGAAGPMNVIAVPITGDAGATVLGQNPFLQTGGYEGNVVFVP